jgi:hypothetical protein
MFFLVVVALRISISSFPIGGAFRLGFLTDHSCSPERGLFTGPNQRAAPIRRRAFTASSRVALLLTVFLNNSAEPRQRKSLRRCCCASAASSSPDREPELAAPLAIFGSSEESVPGITFCGAVTSAWRSAARPMGLVYARQGLAA